MTAAGEAATRVVPTLAQETKDIVSGYADEVTVAEKPLAPRARRELAANVKTLLTADASQRPAARTAVVNTLVGSGAMPAENANATVDEWIKSYDTAKAEIEQAAATAAAKAREAADQAAATGGIASIWIFIAFWVGAVVSVCSGYVGAVGWHRKVATVEVRQRPVPAT